MGEYRSKVDTFVDLEGLFHLLSRMTGVLVFKTCTAVKYICKCAECFIFKGANSPTSS